MAKKMTMHVITGTHWDREWRHTAEQSKLRLADLMDNIIDILENKTTIRATAKKFGIPKSTVHHDLSTKLKYINYTRLLEEQQNSRKMYGDGI